jgi:KUP system potassium uptake protein
MFTDTTNSASRKPILALAALGVVFGDIGTSPLYTLKACFDFSGAVPTSAADVIGIASLLIWALVLVVCVKYIGVIMRVDHDGEGGILALLALGTPHSGPGRPVMGGALLITVVIGAAMLLGDGSITPAISVISAVEGIELFSPRAITWVVPLSTAILIGLFTIQSYGTERIGRLFGPVMVLWFASIALAGAVGIADHPEVLAALDPRHALSFFLVHGTAGFFVLGGIVLAMTGVEALYADLSHFGRRPIVTAWYGMVFPALVLCYLGECAMTLADPTSLDQPLYALTPGVWRVPMILLATCATVIASQALISGVFTLVQQAIALGLAPRLIVQHTSESLRGQVFLPMVNFLLAVGCIALVLMFQSSERLASAFGLAVSCTMLATAFAWYQVAVHVLHWKRLTASLTLSLFMLIDGSFIIAGLPKFMEGGWVPFLISAVLTIALMTWRDGRERIVNAIVSEQVPLEHIRAELVAPLADTSATMVILTQDPSLVPFFQSHEWVRNRMREERIVLLTFLPERVPRIADAARISVQRLGNRLYQVTARFGYMESPRITPVIEACRRIGLELERDDVSYLSAEPKIEAAPGSNRFLMLRRKIFIALSHLAHPLPDELGIKAEQRIGVGVSVPL